MRVRKSSAVAATAALALVGALGVAATAAPTQAARSKVPVEKSLHSSAVLHAFVQYDRPVTDGDVAALRKLGIVKLRPFHLVNAVAVVGVGNLLTRAASLPHVTQLQQDHGIKLLLDESKKAIGVDRVRAAPPKGFGLNGAGVRVAVLDSGVDATHPDLATRVVANYNFEGSIVTDSYQDGAAGDQLVSATAPFAMVDEVGHGTHVSSTIAGTGAASLSGRDFSGMAPGAELVNYKIASGAQGVEYDFGWELNAMAAIEHLIEHNKDLKVRIVSNSWGVAEVNNPDAEPIIQMVRAGIRSGLIFVFAAGNSGSEGQAGENTVGWPGAMGDVITVAATSKTKPYGVASFSSRGYQVDIAAPGVDIMAARSRGIPLDLGLSIPDAGIDAPFYMAISGTSMATPHVAGVAALLAQANPFLTGQLFEEIIERTATDLGAPGKDTKYGWGFLDAYRSAKVATCLGKLGPKPSKAKREGCFASAHALPLSKWRSDWLDSGMGSPTDQGGVIPGV